LEELATMRPFGFDDVEQLRAARARAQELEAAWRTANYPRSQTRRTPSGTRRGALRVAREAAGRWLVGLGQRLLPTRTEPCA